MDIPSALETQIREGRAVLVLGAGASLSATDKFGNHPPKTSDLTNLLSDRYLGGNYKDFPLNQVAEFAISETDLVTVQEYIRNLLEPFNPSRAHRMLPSFAWRAIATTNYDRLIERAYESDSKSLQIPRPFIENGDRIEDRMRDSRAVMLLKLHGCITRTTNPNCPLILTTDQYIEHRKGRSRIFDHFTELSRENTLVFVGQSLQDPDLRAILLELTKETTSRPRYYMVAPSFDDVQKRFWENRKITPLCATFEQFMECLDSRIRSDLRGLSVARPQTEFPIQERFKKLTVALSQACIQFLNTDVEYVKGVSATSTVDPIRFYKGTNPGWSAVEQKLDVPRQLSDTILTEHFLIEESEHLERTEFILIKAHAGAGKTVALRRIAWDAAHDYDCLCLYLKPYGVINAAAIQELINLCQERIYLFVDDAADRIRELTSLFKNIGPEGKLLTVIAAERINEWNSTNDSLGSSVTTEYELRYLSLREIDRLLELLESHRALGTLEHQSYANRRRAFSELAGRQLLVALHEATLGKPFEDIIVDEYSHISPAQAQRIYLTICVLNRLGVPVRAGIISRVHGVQFEEFREKLFAPLEHVVESEENPVIRDFVYRARHPHIAEIVFERVLNQAEERYDAYIRCMRALNVDYQDDARAFRQMVHGRTLTQVFPNHDLAIGVFDVARELVGDESYLLHQMALYEMHRSGGNLQFAGKLLTEAAAKSTGDMNIRHSLAEHSLRCAESARTPLEREKYLTQAASIASEVRNTRPDDVHGYHTIIKVAISRLRPTLEKAEGVLNDEVESVIRHIERNLSDALQRFPGDSYLHDAEAQLASLLSDSDRMVASLKQAFDSNPRVTYIALRLTRCYLARGEKEAARLAYENALESNRNEVKLHYGYAKLLLSIDGTPGDLLTYHLRRSFAPGDNNYDARLLHARQLYINGEFDLCRDAFRILSKENLDSGSRGQQLYPLAGKFQGEVVKIEAGYCLIARDQTQDRLFAHRSEVSDEFWNQLTVGTRVCFVIAFNSRGPIATRVSRISASF